MFHKYVKHVSSQPTVGTGNNLVKGLSGRNGEGGENYVTKGLRIRNIFLYKLQDVG
jgi:hypothetical protein